MQMFLDPVKKLLIHDAPYAWFMRELASRSPTVYNQDLAEYDIRLDSFIQSFVYSEEKNDSLLSKLKPHDLGVIFIRCTTAMRCNNKSIFTETLNWIKDESHEKELISALCWLPFEISKPFINELSSHSNPLIRAACLASYGFFNKNIDPEFIKSYLNDTDTNVVVQAIKIIGENKLHCAINELTPYLEDNNARLRFYATRSIVLLDKDKIPLSILEAFTYSDNPYLSKAIMLLYCIVDTQKSTSIVERIHNACLSPRIKMLNIAMAGMSINFHILLEWMQHEKYAPLAGEAFSFITGLDIELNNFSLSMTNLNIDEISLAKNRKHDPWSQGYEDNLPWPDYDSLVAWYRQHKHKFKSGQRYLAGKVFSQSNFQNILTTGTQTQRQIAAVSLSLEQTELPLLNIMEKASRKN